MEKNDIISLFRLGIDVLKEPKKYNGFFGISASYPFFSDESLKDYCEKYYNHKCIDEFIEFGSNYFNKFLVILVDYLLHYNLMAFNNIAKEEAENTAKKVGNILEERIKKALSGYENKIIFLRLEDIKENKEFNYVLKTVREYACKNTKFSKECTDLTISGTWNKLKIIRNEYGNKRYKQALYIAKNYSLDDTSLCLYLYNNFPIEISKYDATFVIKNIYNGLFPELKDRLKLFDMGHIQLSFKSPVHQTFYDDEWEDTKSKCKIK